MKVPLPAAAAVEEIAYLERIDDLLAYNTEQVERRRHLCRVRTDAEVEAIVTKHWPAGLTAHPDDLLRQFVRAILTDRS